jgi:hypothetical protein
METEYILIVGLSSLLVVLSSGFLTIDRCRRRPNVGIQDWVANPAHV